MHVASSKYWVLHWRDCPRMVSKHVHTCNASHQILVGDLDPLHAILLVEQLVGSVHLQHAQGRHNTKHAFATGQLTAGGWIHTGRFYIVATLLCSRGKDARLQCANIQ